MENKNERVPGIAKAVCALGLLALACAGPIAVETSMQRSGNKLAQGEPVEIATKLVIVGTGDSYSQIAYECAPQLSYTELQNLNSGKRLVAGDTVTVPADSSCKSASEYKQQLVAKCEIETITAYWGDNPDSLASRAGMSAGAFGALNGITTITSVQQGESYNAATACQNGFQLNDLR